MVDNSVDNLAQRDAGEILLTGDVILDVPDPDHWLGGLAPALRSAQLAIGHLEVPHTRRGTETSEDVPAPAADPDAIAALARAGFDVMTLAGNHMADQGAPGIEDTLDALAAAGIPACGAGMSLDAARRAARIETHSTRIAVLSYNCVGPESGWASESRAGCAYLPIKTADGGAVAPTAELLAPGDAAAAVLESDIGEVRDWADVVIVALHKGVVHTPVVLAPYEAPLGQLVIDCGADAVVSHHAHIVKGVQVYRGKPIFHGLGNGCVVTRALAPEQNHPGRAAWARRRRELFGFEPDPAYELAPFHPQAVNAMLAALTWMPDEGLRFGIVPVHVEAPGRPVLAAGDRGVEIIRYGERITRDAGLPEIHFTEEPRGWFVQL